MAAIREFSAVIPGLFLLMVGLHAVPVTAQDQPAGENGVNARELLTPQSPLVEHPADYPECMVSVMEDDLHAFGEHRDSGLWLSKQICENHFRDHNPDAWIRIKGLQSVGVLM